jgi:hypothetical protein
VGVLGFASVLLPYSCSALQNESRGVRWKDYLRTSIVQIDRGGVDAVLGPYRGAPLNASRDESRSRRNVR